MFGYAPAGCLWLAAALILGGSLCLLRDEIRKGRALNAANTTVAPV